MSLDKLKSTNNLDKLLSAVKEDNKDPSEKKSYVDERLWKPELDTSGNGYAVIRFLPAIEGEDLPWVKLFSHAFQGPTGQWYIENSRTTLAEVTWVKTQYQSTTVLCGTLVLKLTKRLQENKRESYLTTQISML